MGRVGVRVCVFVCDRLMPCFLYELRIWIHGLLPVDQTHVLRAPFGQPGGICITKR